MQRVNMMLTVTAAVTALVGIAVYATVSREWSEPAAAGSDDPQVSADAEILSPPVAVQQAVERPLFFANRRMPPPDAPVVTTASEPQKVPFPEADLLGIFGSRNTQGAILRSGEKVQRVVLGGEWQRWRLVAMDEKRGTVDFMSPDGRYHSLRLKRQEQQGNMIADIPEQKAVSFNHGHASAGTSSQPEGSFPPEIFDQQTGQKLPPELLQHFAAQNDSPVKGRP